MKNIFGIILIIFISLYLYTNILAPRGIVFRKSQYKREEKLNAVPMLSDAIVADDKQLVKRIISAYQLANKPVLGKSMWHDHFNDHHHAIHHALQTGSEEEVTTILRDPASSDLFYGIDNLCKSCIETMTEKESMALLSLDQLIRLGEAIGSIKKDNPEADRQKSRYWDGANVIYPLEQGLNVTLNFPTPYPNELGAWTSRGICSYRASHAIFQAYLIKSYLKNIPNPKVLEIGAGLGRTAYFARLLGIKDYTIVDIPMTAVCSGYFLGRTLGEDQVLLLGEASENPEERVKVLTPETFLNDANQKYDLIINVDSLSEMDKSVATAYIEKIAQSTPIFISINHEANTFSVRELLAEHPKVNDYRRNHYWMREGYAEEIFKFK